MKPMLFLSRGRVLPSAALLYRLRLPFPAVSSLALMPLLFLLLVLAPAAFGQSSAPAPEAQKRHTRPQVETQEMGGSADDAEDTQMAPEEQPGAQAAAQPAAAAQDQAQSANQPQNPAPAASPAAPAPATPPGLNASQNPAQTSPAPAKAPAAGQSTPSSPTAANATGSAPSQTQQSTFAPTDQSGQGKSGQTGQPSPEQNGQFTIQTNVNEVNLIFTVTDKHGHFIPNLQQKDFALLDDQKAPSQVFNFTQQTNLPLRVGILIDASTSIRQRFEFEQSAAVQFLQQVVRRQTDLAFVMGFDVTPYITQKYTNNPDLLEAGINKMRPGGGTALFDAVYTACRDQLLNVPGVQGSVRKALIVISDGDDNQSRAYPDDAIKMCQRAETIIYAISTNVSPSRDRGDDVLKRMAESTGGTAFFPHRIEDMANSFHDIEEELRSQYSLAYRPSDFKPDGSFRSIYLVALDRRFTVRTRKGYFAPKG